MGSNEKPSQVEVEETLTLPKLASGDRPSVYTTGFVTSASLVKNKIAILMVDVLGRVVVMPPSSVEVKSKPLLSDADLNSFDEDDAILLMSQEERSDDEIVEYLRRREGK